MKILVIAFRALGDMVLITPILRLLKTSNLHAELTVVADSIGYEVLLHNPYIDRLIVLDRNKSRSLPFVRRLQREWDLLSDLRSKQFDVTIDLFGGPRSALISFLSGTPVRCGEDVPRRLRCRLYTHRATVSREGEHLVLQKLKIIRPLIGNSNCSEALELFLTRKEKEWGAQCLHKAGIQTRNIIVGLFPGAGWEHKRWSPEKFAALGDRLTKTFGLSLLLIGGVRDREACQEVSSKMAVSPIILIQNSVRETMAIIDQLDLFVSNDTGPMHIAVALGCPTIALFGPSNIIKYGPWKGKAKIITKNLLCSPCPQQIDTCLQVGRERQECMKQIEVEEVYQAAIAFLDIAGVRQKWT